MVGGPSGGNSRNDIEPLKKADKTITSQDFQELIIELDRRFKSEESLKRVNAARARYQHNPLKLGRFFFLLSQFSKLGAEKIEIAQTKIQEIKFNLPELSGTNFNSVNLSDELNIDSGSVKIISKFLEGIEFFQRNFFPGTSSVEWLSRAMEAIPEVEKNLTMGEVNSRSTVDLYTNMNLSKIGKGLNLAEIFKAGRLPAALAGQVLQNNPGRLNGCKYVTGAQVRGAEGMQSIFPRLEICTLVGTETKDPDGITRVAKSLILALVRQKVQRYLMETIIFGKGRENGEQSYVNKAYVFCSFLVGLALPKELEKVGFQQANRLVNFKFSENKRDEYKSLIGNTLKNLGIKSENVLSDCRAYALALSTLFKTPVDSQDYISGVVNESKPVKVEEMLGGKLIGFLTPDFKLNIVRAMFLVGLADEEIANSSVKIVKKHLNPEALGAFKEGIVKLNGIVNDGGNIVDGQDRKTLEEAIRILFKSHDYLENKLSLPLREKLSRIKKFRDTHGGKIFAADLSSYHELDKQEQRLMLGGLRYLAAQSEDAYVLFAVNPNSREDANSVKIVRASVFPLDGDGIEKVEYTVDDTPNGIGAILNGKISRAVPLREIVNPCNIEDEIKSIRESVKRILGYNRALATLKENIGKRIILPNGSYIEFPMIHYTGHLKGPAGKYNDIGEETDLSRLGRYPLSKIVVRYDVSIPDNFDGKRSSGVRGFRKGAGICIATRLDELIERFTNRDERFEKRYISSCG